MTFKTAVVKEERGGVRGGWSQEGGVKRVVARRGGARGWSQKEVRVRWRRREKVAHSSPDSYITPVYSFQIIG